MLTVVEGKNSIQVATLATIVEDSHDCAWAERNISPNPSYKWILGKYVEADNANSNMQYWSLEGLRRGQKTLRNSPLNLLHKPKYVVGSYVDSELVYPTDGAQQETVTNPFIEALAVYWKYYFPKEYEDIEEAHSNGELFFSMECVSDTITEIWPDGSEGETFKYMGPNDPSYSDAINNRECARRFDNPHFLGGALIVPPTRPGWKRAEVKEISELFNVDFDQSIEDIEEEDEISPELWMSLMGLLMDLSAKKKKRNGGGC